MESTLEFLRTGITGLDKILKGGLPKGWVVTVSGGPGTGKTTLALEFIYRGALEYNEPGLIVTFNDTKTNIIKTYNLFGWDFEKLEEDGLVSILDYSTSSLVYLEKAVETGKFTLEFIISQIMREIEEINAKRAVIDPLNALSLLFPNEFQVRKEVHKLFGLLSNMNCTSLCTFELKRAEIGDNEFTLEEFIAQGLIRLYYLRSSMNRLRRIEVVKMRGVKQDSKIYPFEIAENGIWINTESEAFEIDGDRVL